MVIDIALLLVKYLKLGIPLNEENIFDKLSNHLDNIERLKEMKRFRNVLVHRYEGINNKIVFFNANENLDDFYDYISQVKKILNDN